LIGQKLAGGSQAANTYIKITNADQAIALCGRGSMLHLAARAWFKNNTFTELFLGVLADNGAGVSAAGQLSVTGPATGNGTLALYIGGRLVSIAVTSGQTAIQIAAAIAAAITADLDMPVTAMQQAPANDFKVTVTYRHKGLVGNYLDMRFNYQDGEALPAGVAIAVTAMAGGTSNPMLDTLIAALGDKWFHIMAHPYTDATSLTALETELAGRDGPMRQIDGITFAGAAATLGAFATLGNSRNSQYLSIPAQPGDNSLTPPYEWAAAVAAAVAFYGNIDPARPFQTIPVVGALPPAELDLYTLQERNLLLYEGIATSKVGAGGVVQIERLVTAYKVNAAGAADTAYLDVNTRLTLMYLRYSFNNWFLTRYPRHKLADDSVLEFIGSGQPVITPLIAAGEAIAWFDEMQELGLVDGKEQFVNDLVVVRSGTDVNRLDFLLPPDLMNQLIVTATKGQFRL
jgi:phage tail sheath gpL-like